MPGYTLTGGYKLERVRQVGKTQTAIWGEKYRSDRHEIVVSGIPADVDLSGNVEMTTWNMSGSEKKDESKPDHMVIRKVDEKGETVPNSYVKLFRGQDGTYRRQTEEEERITEEQNMGLIRTAAEMVKANKR